MTELAPEPRERLEHLTAMEQACLRLVGRHLSSKEIAAELGIAKTSVDTYCNRARAKLGVADRYEAARLLQATQSPELRACPPKPPAPAAETAPPAVEVRPATDLISRSSSRLVAMLAVGFVLVLALATLLAGLRALEEMKPLS